jgi:hypothetical protein
MWGTGGHGAFPQLLQLSEIVPFFHAKKKFAWLSERHEIVPK